MDSSSQRPGSTVWRDGHRPSPETAAILRERFAAIHEMPAEVRETAYRKLVESDDYTDLKRAMNRWCAAWFWPAQQEPALTPSVWSSPTPAVDEIVDQLHGSRLFFHWEIEFPDVFRPDRRGFDAMLGNPPWEISKPNSKEFFSNEDPLYRTYAKQEALAIQRRLFATDSSIEDGWVRYQAGFKAMSNWVSASSEPFAVTPGRGREADLLAKSWVELRRSRTGTADPEQPFRYQGSADLNTYKLFLEVAHHLLAPGGRLGFVVPSGIWRDAGSEEPPASVPRSLSLGVVLRLRECAPDLPDPPSVSVCAHCCRARGKVKHGAHRLHATRRSRVGAPEPSGASNQRCRGAPLRANDAFLHGAEGSPRSHPCGPDLRRPPSSRRSHCSNRCHLFSRARHDK